MEANREIRDGSWVTSVHPIQRVAVVLTRLRIGHTRQTHGRKVKHVVRDTKSQ